MSKLDKFLILIIIINLFASIFIVFSNGNAKEVDSFKIENFSEFSNVYIAGPSADRYKDFLQELVENRFNILYNDTKNLNDVQLREYYNQNNTKDDEIVISKLESQYGISDYNTFSKLVTKLREINDKGAKYKKCSIVKKSCKMNSEYTTSEVEITYSKFKKINMTVDMSNTIKYNMQMFKITVKEDE